MEPVVPPEVTAELTQILSNLVLGDNEIRANAERAVNERLAQTPEVYLLALTQFATAADTEVMRSFSLVLLRRLLFRSVASPNGKAARLTLYDRLSSQTLTTLERLLLHSLSHEPADVVRRKTVDTTCDLANYSMARGRPWHALQAQAFAMTQSEAAGQRESAYRVFAGCPNLVMDLQTDAVLRVLQKGLQDPQSVEVRHAALRASVSYLTSCDPHQAAQSLSLMYPMLETLPPLPHSHLPKFLNTLTPLTSSSAQLFAPHLPALLAFLPALILPSADPGPTPTVARPFPGSQGAFAFPPEQSDDHEQERDEEAEEVRKAALEFMISLSEARPSMVRRVDGWVGAIVRGCLGGMGELRDDELQTWLEADPSEDPTDDTYPHVYEQSLDRLACALGGKAVLPAAFQHIPGMLASHDWRLRHAGLMAIAAVGEGTSKVMQNELGKVVELITPSFSDSYPRVRYAACQCVGQLCTDLEEVIQAEYHQQLFTVLIPTLEAPEARVHSHAAAALINFCEGVERDTLLPYLDPIVERLLKLLNPADDPARQVKRYVQEQAVTTLAMVADASESTFAKHYAAIMPLLLNVLRNANAPEYRKLRAKAMECAGLIAIAVGRDVFLADADSFVELLIRIQNSPVDPGDTMLPHYLIATWAKVCQAMGPDFERFLPVVMPPLLRAASIKADVSIYGAPSSTYLSSLHQLMRVAEDDEAPEDKEGWETIRMDGQQVGIRTAAIDEKCQAFETMVIYCSTLGAKFAPYLPQCLELVLPSLRFFLHDGVREACAMMIPMLISCGQNSHTLTDQMATATFSHIIACISSEGDSSFLSSLYKCFTDTLRVIGGAGALPGELQVRVLDATKRQLQALAEKRKTRGARSPAEIADEKEDLALLEEMEDFALEDMSKMLALFDPAHPLLIAVSSVRDLGLKLSAWDSEDEGADE
ncbi:ARM repeat-containing protein [Auriscalpium vulgare]|uniref:ARM repeat-containing protein n=1 Tax=Auriscalpium vulgare TaxID=40419 RepID=A0ACB8RRN6_9AGAM|nr:ARM repeat-containing protein [Auriscalpium vulgare]